MSENGNASAQLITFYDQGKFSMNVKREGSFENSWVWDKAFLPRPDVIYLSMNLNYL